MKTDIQGCSTCPIGGEQYEEFTDSLHPRGAVQYDYRHPSGRLFSCVAKTLEECRDRRNNWIEGIEMSEFIHRSEVPLAFRAAPAEPLADALRASSRDTISGYLAEKRAKDAQGRHI